MRFLCVIGILCLACLVAPLVGAAQAPTGAEPAIAALTPTVPGGVQRLVIQAPTDATHVAATAFDGPVHLGRTATGAWEGLLGVDLDRPAGDYPVVVTTTVPGGRAATARAVLVVRARRFRTRTLAVDARFIEPSEADAKRMQDDAARLGAVLAGVSERRWAGPFVPPVAGVATSNFGTRSIFNGQPRAPHAGVDYRSSVGTPIAAPNEGRVVLAEDLFLTGNTVVVDHGLGLFSLFAHLSRIDVAVGDDVATARPLGLVGATGRVTGPHLHWSVRASGARIDPALLLRALAR